MRVADLPRGPAARVDRLVGRQLRWHGRTVVTDLPLGVGLTLLGSVDGHVVGVQQGADGPRDQFWTVDPDGHARQLGARYESYDYAPVLVERTGHLWVHFEDRTTPRTIREVDARTGREVAAYPHDQVPHGLAPADQALVDAWVARRVSVPASSDRSPDGELIATTSAVYVGAADPVAVVTVRTDDRRTVRRFGFPGVARVVFEDDQHVLVQAAVRARGERQAIVRCSLGDGSCERTTDVGRPMSLGVDRPHFTTAG